MKRVSAPRRPKTPQDAGANTLLRFTKIIQIIVEIRSLGASWCVFGRLGVNTLLYFTGIIQIIVKVRSLWGVLGRLGVSWGVLGSLVGKSITYIKKTSLCAAL